jgi:hypothetical protein
MSTYKEGYGDIAHKARVPRCQHRDDDVGRSGILAVKEISQALVDEMLCSRIQQSEGPQKGKSTSR